MSRSLPLSQTTGYHTVPNVTINGEQHDVVIDICGHGIGSNGPCGSMASTLTAHVCFKNGEEAFILGSKTDAQMKYVLSLLP